MKFSLKTLAAAVMMVAAASGANAAIDNGYESGNGELFVNIWDANGSYTRDLNITIDAFQSALAAPGNFNQIFTADSTLTSFLAGTAGGARQAANLLKFDILATDVNGDNRILATYNTSALPKVMTDDTTSSAAASVMLFANAVNNVGNDSIAVGNTSPAYANKTGNKIGTVNSLLTFNNFGTLAANTGYSSGLNFLRIDGAASGAADSVYTQFTDNGSSVKVWFDSSNALHIAAATVPVPEPESYAMLLAGLGMLGFMARRRLNNRA